MPRKVHMQDQVSNKVEDIINHYNGYSMEMWGLKALALAMFLLVGVYW
jgi:hypothetical protein